MDTYWWIIFLFLFIPRGGATGHHLMATTTSGSLTAAQKTAIRNDVTANSDLNVIPHGPNDGSGFYTIAQLYNLPASPAFTVYRTAIPSSEIRNVIDATELDGLTILKLTQLEFMLKEPVDASVPDRRTFFAKVFSGTNGTNTLPRLTTLSKRFATRAEKLLAIGTGSDAAPAVMGFEGQLGMADIASLYEV